MDEDKNSFEQIQLDEYLAVIKPELMRTDPDKSKVGVIVARGIILDGTQPAGKIGGDER